MQPTLRITQMDLACSDEGTLHRWQVWLIIGNRPLEIGPHLPTPNDIDSLVVLLQRVIPNLVIEGPRP